MSKHGHSSRSELTPTYRSWAGIKRRCLIPSHDQYPRYGGRGILVCDRWLGPNGFLNFLADMGERPDGMTIDRIDPNGNYEPGNCRWATADEQTANRRPASQWKPRTLSSHCSRGHKYTEANTYNRRDGARACRACHAAKARTRRSNAVALADVESEAA